MMEPNGCRVIFGFPGAAMQKGNMAHGDGEDRMGEGEEPVAFKLRGEVKFSSKCADHDMAPVLGFPALNP